MAIDIHSLSRENIQDVNQCDGSFVVESHLVLALENGKLAYSNIPIEAYVKEYPIEEMVVTSFLDNPEKVILLAYVNEVLAGQIDVVKWWNEYAYVNAFAVKKEFRKQGVGHALMDKTIEWAKTNQYPGIMLETQNNNLPACELYKHCGFELKGFDEYLYKGVTPDSKEIALFWYLLFDRE